MQKYAIPNMRLSATSFLLHETYVPAVRFAAERCDDVALLLVETGERGEYLATPDEIREIGRIADGEGVTLHVHLPTDADFDTREGARAMLGKVRRAAELTGPLDPHSFVLHVDFPSLHGTGREPSAEQQGWTAEALREIAACLPAPERLAVENLETYPPSFWDRWLAGMPYSRCLDVGHIWKDNGDPAAILTAWLPRVRVIHLHGLEPRKEATPHGAVTGSEGGGADPEVPQGDARTGGMPPDGNGSTHGWADSDGKNLSACQGAAGLPDGGALPRLFGPRPRDHKSLRLMPPALVDTVMHPLWRAGFNGVLNLEVFCVEDFTASHAVLMHSWERYMASF